MPFATSPYVKEEKPGTVAYCTCGESAKAPYCDGSHGRNRSMKRPIIVKIDEAKTVAWCGCGKSGNPPYCDGTHSKG